MHKVSRHLNRLLLFLVATNAYATEDHPITISKAWIGEAPPHVTVMAAYLNILNNSTVAKTLYSVSSPDFSGIEIHQTIIQGETVSMRKQSSLSIPAGESLELSPGGYHLMLFNPRKSFRAGDSVLIELSFSDGLTKSMEVIIRKRNDPQHTQHPRH